MRTLLIGAALSLLTSSALAQNVTAIFYDANGDIAMIAMLDDDKRLDTDKAWNRPEFKKVIVPRKEYLQAEDTIGIMQASIDAIAAAPPDPVKEEARSLIESKVDEIQNAESDKEKAAEAAQSEEAAEPAIEVEPISP